MPEYSINQTVTKLGANVIYTVPDKFKNVNEILAYSDNVEGLSNITQVKREFSFRNDLEWSPWYATTDSNLQSYVNIAEDFELRFKFTVSQKYDELPIKIKSLTVTYEEKEVVTEVVERRGGIDVIENVSFDVIPLERELAHLQGQLNKWANKSSPIEVLYFHVEPDMRSADVILNEYSLYDLVNKNGTCIRVVAPDNLIPDPSSHEYNEWGIQFDKFAIHIDKVYFEEIFGKGSKPRDEDFMLFKKVNRLYRVESNYLETGIGYDTTYWVLNLAKYDYNTSVAMDDETKELVTDKLSIHEERFKEEIAMEFEDATNNQQTTLKSISKDPLREEINEAMIISESGVTNNGSLLMKHWYDFTEIEADEEAIRYKKSIQLEDIGSISHTCWFKIPTREDDLRSLDIISQTRIDFNRLELKFNKDIDFIKLEETDSIIRGNSVYRISEIVDDDTIIIFTKHDISASLLDGWKRSQGNNILFVSGDKDFSIDLHFPNKLRITEGIDNIDVDNMFLEYDTWYGLCINISNVHDYLGVYVWRMEDRTGITEEKYSTRLVQHFKREIPLNRDCKYKLDQGSIPVIFGSQIHMSNIRIFKTVIPEDQQSYVLGTLSVKKPSLAYIIDDADVVFNMGDAGRGNTYIQDIESDKENRKHE